VAQLDMSTYDYTLARRKDGTAIFANESRGSRYYVEEMAVQAVAGRSNMQASTNLCIYANLCRHVM